jgi:hypothetical protein
MQVNFKWDFLKTEHTMTTEVKILIYQNVPHTNFSLHELKLSIELCHLMKTNSAHTLHNTVGFVIAQE